MGNQALEKQAELPYCALILLFAPFVWGVLVKLLVDEGPHLQLPGPFPNFRFNYTTGGPRFGVSSFRMRCRMAGSDWGFEMVPFVWFKRKTETMRVDIPMSFLGQEVLNTPLHAFAHGRSSQHEAIPPF